ncbi:hypothetical protein V8B97DRAFT_165295 [Scleroderma yunnanense]
MIGFTKHSAGVHAMAFFGKPRVVLAALSPTLLSIVHFHSTQRFCATSMAPPFIEKFMSLLPFKKTESSSNASITPRMDPVKIREHFDRIGHFRILVIGRSNAGKTTILQRVCNTTELPEIFNTKGEKIDPAIVQGSLERGYHDIEDELIFRSNPGFIFHDSRGFEAGSDDELRSMKKFVAERATAMKLEKRIHAIWFCIPMTECERPIVAAEEKFFNECNTAHVPVIVVLTKADAIESLAIGQLRDEGFTMKEAIQRAKEPAVQMLSKLKMRIEAQLAGCKYPPKDCVSLASMNEDHADCNALLRCTTNALDEEELQKLVISTQQVNVVLNIEYAVK